MNISAEFPGLASLDAPELRLHCGEVGHIEILDIVAPRRGYAAMRRSEGISGWIESRSRSVAFESGLERQFAVMATVDPQVVAVRSQPFTIIYRKEGAKRTGRYTPDYFVERDLTIPTIWRPGRMPNLQRALVEVKPYARAFPSGHVAWLAGSEVAWASGWQWSVAGERVMTPRIMSVAERIWSRQPARLSVSHHELVAILPKNRPMSLRSVKASLNLRCSLQDIIELYYPLIRERLVTMNLLENDLEEVQVERVSGKTHPA